MYTFIKKWSNSTKNRAFLWRFFYGLVYTNEDFVRFGFKESRNCSFCNAEGQTKEHLFLLCPKVIEFREKVLDTFKNLIERSKLTDKALLFGVNKSKNNADDERANTVIALINKFIYYSNTHEKDLSIFSFKAELNQMEQVEYNIAYKKGNLGLHLSKWETINNTWQ